MCCTKDGVLKDRREMLKVKVKSLAEEARIIRREERRTQGTLRDELAWHRRSTVRWAARTSHMAYGLIRGRAIDQIERPGTQRSVEYWKEVRKMVQKYGPVDEDVQRDLAAIEWK